jgi:hypothetical protein
MVATIDNALRVWLNKMGKVLGVLVADGTQADSQRILETLDREEGDNPSNGGGSSPTPAGNLLGTPDSAAPTPGNSKNKDDKATKITDAAKDSSKSIDQRAIDAVNSIVKTYYDPALVEKVVYVENEPGLMTTAPVGKEKKGQITVGKYFIENIDKTFARRVLQVGHELQHIEQQRSGMGGPAKKNEREFLGFYWEATQSEKAGTGRMSHSGRVLLIDEALRNYYCMPAEDQKTHAAKKDELLKLREKEEKAGGQDHTEPPTTCGKK